jgi:hypothetical protein
MSGSVLLVAVGATAPTLAHAPMVTPTPASRRARKTRAHLQQALTFPYQAGNEPFAEEGAAGPLRAGFRWVVFHFFFFFIKSGGKEYALETRISRKAL